MIKNSIDRRHLTAAPIGFAIAAVLTFFSPSASVASTGEQPTVVELFQSQGCSSCPPANANVIALSDRTDLLTLSFGVTYWDKLGWKDTFASPQYTERQWDYARAFKHREVFTPQVVINGRADVVGQNRSELEAAIERAARPAGGPGIRSDARLVIVGPAKNITAHADVWLVRYDSNIVQVPIQRGENGGRTLPHKNVVHELTRLGDWSGHEQTYPIPGAARPGLREAVLVQQVAGGPILAAARR